MLNQRQSLGQMITLIGCLLSNQYTRREMKVTKVNKQDSEENTHRGLSLFFHTSAFNTVSGYLVWAQPYRWLICLRCREVRLVKSWMKMTHTLFFHSLLVFLFWMTNTDFSASWYGESTSHAGKEHTCQLVVGLCQRGVCRDCFLPWLAQTQTNVRRRSSQFSDVNRCQLGGCQL